MSATRPSRPEVPSPRARPADVSALRTRRRAARRRTRLARIDVSIGVLAAIVLLLVSPGLAMTAVIALALLTLCLTWIAAERTLGRRRARGRSGRDTSDSQRDDRSR